MTTATTRDLSLHSRACRCSHRLLDVFFLLCSELLAPLLHVEALAFRMHGYPHVHPDASEQALAAASFLVSIYVLLSCNLIPGQQVWEPPSICCGLAGN